MLPLSSSDKMLQEFSPMSLVSQLSSLLLSLIRQYIVRRLMFAWISTEGASLSPPSFLLIFFPTSISLQVPPLSFPWQRYGINYWCQISSQEKRIWSFSLMMTIISFSPPKLGLNVTSLSPSLTS